MQENNLKCIWIPYKILTNEKLSNKEKYIYSLILFFSKNKNYCTITNKYIANIVNLSDNSYRKLLNAFHEYITSKGFDLERGLPIEETGAKHQNIEELKKITNFENTKKILDNIKLELPEVSNINDIKIIKLNREKVENEI